MLNELPYTENTWEEYLYHRISEVKSSGERVVLVLDKGLYDRKDHYDTGYLVEKLLEEEVLQKNDSIICISMITQEQFKDLTEIAKSFDFQRRKGYKGEVIEVNGIRICNFNDFIERENFILGQFSEEKIEASKEVEENHPEIGS